MKKWAKALKKELGNRIHTGGSLGYGPNCEHCAIIMPYVIAFNKGANRV